MLRKKADGWPRSQRTLYTKTAEGRQLLLNHPIGIRTKGDRIEGGAVIGQIKKVFYRWLNSEGNPNSLLFAMALGVASFGILLSFLAFQSPVFEPSPRRPMVAEIELFNVPPGETETAGQSNQTKGVEPSDQAAKAVSPNQPDRQPVQPTPSAASASKNQPIKATPKTAGEVKAKSTQDKEPIPAPKALEGVKPKAINQVESADKANEPAKPGKVEPALSSKVEPAPSSKAEPASIPVVKLEAKPLVTKPIAPPQAVSPKVAATVQSKPATPRPEAKTQRPATAMVKPAAKLQATKPGKPAVKTPAKTQTAQKPQSPDGLTSKPLGSTKPATTSVARVEAPKVAISVRTDPIKGDSPSSDITFTMPSHQQAGSPSIVKVEPLVEATPNPSEQATAQPAGVIPMVPREGCTRVRQVGLVGDMQATVVETVPAGSNDCMYP